MATLQAASPSMYTWYKRIPARRGLATFGGRHLFQCRDGRWISFVIMPYRWDDFVRWLADEGIDSEVREERWRDQAFRTQQPGPVSAAIEALAGRHTREELFHEGQRRLMSVMPVNDVKDIVEDRQLRERRFFASFEHAETKKMLVDAGPAPAMSRTPLRLRRPAPALGEHNREVYLELLGLSEGELAMLQAEGVL